MNQQHHNIISLNCAKSTRIIVKSMFTSSGRTFLAENYICKCKIKANNRFIGVHQYWDIHTNTGYQMFISGCVFNLFLTYIVFFLWYSIRRLPLGRLVGNSVFHWHCAVCVFVLYYIPQENGFSMTTRTRASIIDTLLLLFSFALHDDETYGGSYFNFKFKNGTPC